MKRLSLVTLAASLVAATNASAFETVMSPFDVSQEANRSNGYASTSLYDFTPSKMGKAFEGEALGLSFVDQNAAFGPEVSLVETGNRRAGFRLGVGYDISNSSAPSLDGRRDTSVSAFQSRYGNRTTTSGLASDDDDDLSVNLGFRLNF